jgi:hypothetical protein
MSGVRYIRLDGANCSVPQRAVNKETRSTLTFPAKGLKAVVEKGSVILPEVDAGAASTLDYYPSCQVYGIENVDADAVGHRLVVRNMLNDCEGTVPSRRWLGVPPWG